MIISKNSIMKHQVHVAIQVVPIAQIPHYPIIDKAIEVIDASGVNYRVGAMETVMQGDYNTIMDVVRRAQEHRHTICIGRSHGIHAERRQRVAIRIFRAAPPCG